MASKIRENLQNEIFAAAEKDPANSKYYEELYNILDGMSDKDAYNYINSGSQYILQSPAFPTFILEESPTLRKALHGNLLTGTVDYDKEFGYRWYDDFENIPSDKIAMIAEEQGMKTAELAQQMAQEATKRRRYDLAHGDNPDATIMDKVAGKLAIPMLFPRSQEAVEEGRSPTTSEVIGDVGQNFLYAAPWSRGSVWLANSGLKQIPKVGKVFSKVASSTPSQFMLGNALTPTITELYDATFMDDGSDRGQFSVSDVAGGTMMNAAAPWLIKAPLLGIGKFAGNKDLSKQIMDYGAGKTAKEIARENFGKYKNAPIRKADDPTITVGERNIAKQMRILSESDPALYKLLTKNPVGGKIPEGSKWASLSDIMGSEGKNVEEKIKNMLKNRGFNPEYSYITPNGRIFSANNAEDLINILKQNKISIPYDLEIHLKYPKHAYSPVSKELLNSYDKYVAEAAATESAKNEAQLVGEEAIKNWMTNHFGDYAGTQNRDPWRIIPLFGPAIEEAVNGTDEEKAEAARKAEEAEILEGLTKKYGSVGDVFKSKR